MAQRRTLASIMDELQGLPRQQRRAKLRALKKAMERRRKAVARGVREMRTLPVPSCNAHPGV